MNTKSIKLRTTIKFESSSTPLSGGKPSQQKGVPSLDNALKNAGANWAEEVVRAAVKDGNQWDFDGSGKGGGLRPQPPTGDAPGDVSVLEL